MSYRACANIFGMEWGWLIGKLLSPFVALLLFAIAIPIALLIRRYLPEGKLKRILFFHWNV